MELENYYEDSDCTNIKYTCQPPRYDQNERADGKSRNRCIRCLVLMTVCLGILCLGLISVIVLQHLSASSKQGFLWGPDGLFMSSEKLIWYDSRRFCRDRGADLVIIDSEEKQRQISLFIKENMWIGLSDMDNEGHMKWVDDSPLKKGFWVEGEPNNYRGENEDCIELTPSKDVLHNWNDIQCSHKRKCICEK